jgi:hypothetical protein
MIPPRSRLPRPLRRAVAETVSWGVFFIPALLCWGAMIFAAFLGADRLGARMGAALETIGECVRALSGWSRAR